MKRIYLGSEAWLSDPESEELEDLPAEAIEPLTDDRDDDTECWCGVRGAWDDLYAEMSGHCGGTRLLECRCAGDHCECHWHGGMVCLGCPDCESKDEGQELFTAKGVPSK